MVVLLYPLLASPSKNHTPSEIFCGVASCPEAHLIQQTSNNESNSIQQPNRRPAPRTPFAPKTQRPRKCAASVATVDETLAIAATLWSTGTRTTRPPSTTTASTAWPSLPARPARPLAASSHRNRRSAIGTVKVRLIRRLFAIILEILAILIDLIRGLVRARCSNFSASSIRSNLPRLRQTKLCALLSQNR